MLKHSNSDKLKVRNTAAPSGFSFHLHTVLRRKVEHPLQGDHGLFGKRRVYRDSVTPIPERLVHCL